MPTKSSADVRAELKRKGVSVAQWALANNLSVLTVYGVLSGRRGGSRGEAHRAAVLLGLKDGEVVADDDVKSTLSSDGQRSAA